MSAPPVLEVRNLGKTYPPPRSGAPPPPPVLEHINFTLNAGCFCAITGPSGSGKTTFLNLVGLLDVPSQGDLFIAGEPVHRTDRKAHARIRRDDIGMIFQHMHLLPRRSVLENVLFRARYLPQPRTHFHPRAFELLETLGLSALADRRADTLSGGEAQRVAIARALLNQPRLLLADEPTGNLDPESGETVMQALSLAAANGVAVILVTHNLSLLPHAQRHLRCTQRGLQPVPA